MKIWKKEEKGIYSLYNAYNITLHYFINTLVVVCSHKQIHIVSGFPSLQNAGAANHLLRSVHIVGS